MIRTLLLLLAAATWLTADESIRQSESARFWLKVPKGDPPPSGIVVSSGTATAAEWEKDPASRNQLTDVIFPIRWWSWTEFSIHFTPEKDGRMEIVLNGPWASDGSGKAFRQEILWDEITASGTTILSGGFENPSSPGGSDPWKCAQGSYPASDSWPLAGALPFAGEKVAATWHNRTLSQFFEVKAGQPVTIGLRAMAATIPGFTSPARLGKNTAAHKAAASIKRGVNLGNCWEAPPPYTWGVRFTPEDIDHIADEGFDHIRVPVAWHHHLKGAEIDPKLLVDLEPVLRRAMDRKLHVLLDWHHYYELVEAPAANRSRFVAGWEAIARHFKDWPAALFLELLNEPNGAFTTEVANPIYAETLTAIRKIDPERIIVVSPGNWGSIGELENLRLPDNDDRIIVTVHCYEPFYFTHQKAGWVQLRDLQGIVYPGPPETPFQLPAPLRENAGIRNFVERYNTLPTEQNPCSRKPVRELLDLARDWSDHFGRPVHLGEFGSHDAGDTASRARYFEDVRKLSEERGIPWTLWDWKATFAYWDTRRNTSDFKKALFGN